MRNQLLKILPLITVGLVAMETYAMDFEATFQQLDKDGNGTLSEAEAGEDAVLHENFSQIDSDQNGQLSLSEFKQFIK
jgi:Ca2+-binding EF-hand superfamily protein